jgi:phosphatidylglycerol:prolipoprotein diacylglycerol transferase
MVASYIIGYGAIRFFIEYAREPDKGIGYPITLVPMDNPVYQFSLFNFTTGQILCFLMIAAGVVCMFIFRARARRLAPSTEAPRPTGRKLRKKLK